MMTGTKDWRPWVVMLLVLAWITPAWGEPPGSGWTGLEHMMAPEQFRSAGLSKLTPEELSRLNEWLVRFIAHDSQQLIKSDEAIQELQKAPVRRRISGAFTGWTGNTVFALDNGEVWKQRLPGRYAVKLQNPEVEISRNLLGFYELRLVKTGEKIGVSRIR